MLRRCEGRAIEISTAQDQLRLPPYAQGDRGPDDGLPLFNAPVLKRLAGVIDRGRIADTPSHFLLRERCGMTGGIGISLVNEHGKDDHVEEMKRVAQVMMKYENVKDEGFLCRTVA